MELSNEKEVLENLDKFIYTVEYDNLGEDATAYTIRNINEYVGQHYRIFIDNKNEELEPFYLMHEGGHIIFGHVKEDKIQELNNKNKFRAVYPKFMPYFKDSKFSPEEIYLYFENCIFNMIMDWEVNSKFFTEEEWEYFTKIIGGGCHPKDFDYPEKLSWKDYLNLILSDPDKFMKKFKEQENKQGKGASGGNSSKTKSDANDNGNNETNAQAMERMLEKMKKEYEEGKSVKEKEAEAQKKEDEQARAQGAANRGKSNTGAVDGVLEEGYDSIENLENIILKNIFSKVLVNTKRDCLYNYNRKKYGTNILIPKNRTEKKHRINGLTVILDVSGSVDESDVRKFVNVFKNIAKKLSKNCNLILWNTDFVQEINSADDDTQLFVGGGTRIGKGIKYVAENKKYKDTTLFIVSDFEDDLDEWLEAGYTDKIYGICWDSYSYENSIAHFDSEMKTNWRKLFTKVFINEN